jgi:hypothetical protein
MKLSWLLSSLASVVAVVAQDFVPFPKNVKTTLSEKFPGAKITYKRVNNFCETTPKVRSFSGHITLPKTLIPDAEGWENGSSGSLHFWYFGILMLTLHNFESGLANTRVRGTE